MGWWPRRRGERATAPAAGFAAGVFFLLAVPAAAVEVEVGGTARTSARAVSTNAGDPGASRSADLELLPVGLLAVSVPRTRLELTYAPALTLRDVGRTSAFSALHQGSAVLSWRPEHTRLRLSEEGAFGVADYGPLFAAALGAAPAQVGTSQLASQVPSVRSVSTVALALLPVAHVEASAELSWQLSGGLGGLVLPLQWGPSASLRLQLEPGRLDTLVTAVGASHVEFSTGQRQALAQATQAVRHRFSRITLAELEAGVALADVWSRPVPPEDVLFHSTPVLPIVGAALAATPMFAGAETAARLRARAGPWTDPFTGDLVERLELQAGLSWEWRQSLAFGVTGNGGWSLPSPSVPVQAWVSWGEVSGRWAPARWLELGAAVRGARTGTALPGSAPQDSWLVGVSAMMRDQERSPW